MELAKLENLRQEMINSKKVFDDSFVNFAIKNCGHKIGDVIFVTGFAHRGKEMRITSIHGNIDLWRKEYFAVLVGNVLRKDGTESKNQAETKISLGKI